MPQPWPPASFYEGGGFEGCCYRTVTHPLLSFPFMDPVGWPWVNLDMTASSLIFPPAERKVGERKKRKKKGGGGRLCFVAIGSVFWTVSPSTGFILLPKKTAKKQNKAKKYKKQNLWPSALVHMHSLALHLFLCLLHPGESRKNCSPVATRECP